VVSRCTSARIEYHRDRARLVQQRNEHLELLDLVESGDQAGAATLPARAHRCRRQAQDAIDAQMTG
jgi:hypothetical protein